MAIPRVEDIVVFNESRRPSSAVESDIVSTQLEEQSTVSDQVWDGYQVCIAFKTIQLDKIFFLGGGSFYYALITVIPIVVL